jgi:D-alanine transaminase
MRASPPDSIAYLDGRFGPLAQMRVSVLDRGFIFGDAVYEVIPVYRGRLFRLQQHLERLEASMAAIRIDSPHDRAGWRSLLETLVARNGGGRQAVYLQVTRGVAPRDHAFPRQARPTTFAMSRLLDEAARAEPVRAITLEDPRWLRCDIKATALLPNVLLRQQAVDRGAAEAILLRDGFVTEGAATSVFVVREGAVVTPPEGHLLLSGITRDLVLELAAGAGITVHEAVVPEAALRGADEVWVTSSTTEVAPVIEIDGQPVGSGRPGPVWEQVVALFQAYKSGPDAGT